MIYYKISLDYTYLNEPNEGGLTMKLALIIGVAVVFITSCFTSAYEAKPGVPRKQ